MDGWITTNQKRTQMNKVKIKNKNDFISGNSNYVGVELMKERQVTSVEVKKPKEETKT